MTLPDSFKIIHQRLVRDVAAYHGLLLVASVYCLLLAESGELSNAKEKIQAMIDEPDFTDGAKEFYSEIAISEEELQKLLRELLPKMMQEIHEAFEEIVENVEDEEIRSFAERRISRLLLNTDFAR